MHAACPQAQARLRQSAVNNGECMGAPMNLGFMTFPPSDPFIPALSEPLEQAFRQHRDKGVPLESVSTKRQAMTALPIHALQLVAAVILIRSSAHGIPLEDFYSFGAVTGDAFLPPNDDGFSSPINLPNPFPFFDEVYSTIFVSIMQ